MNKGNKKDNTFLLIRYEEIKDNPLAKFIQILRFAGLSKVIPNTFSNGIEGVVVHPIKVTLNYSIFLAHKVQGK